MEYVRKISSLTTFLYETNPSSDSISRFLVLDTFSAFEPTALLLGLLQSDGTFKVVGHFGLNEAIEKEALAIAQRQDNPFSQSMQKDKVLIYGRLEKIFSNPLNQVEVENDNSSLEYALAWPIYLLGAGLSFFKEEIALDSLDELFFRAIGGMLALHHMYATTLSDISGLPGLNGKTAELSPRQKIIVEELRRGKTNSTIAHDLNFSSSLIRQETMRIYRKLGVSGRKEILGDQIDEEGITSARD